MLCFVFRYVIINSMRKQTRYLVIGLGNPDKQYLDTFHNMGYMTVDRFADVYHAVFNKGECRAITCHVINGDTKIILAKPITYMNLSGESAIELINKYKIEADKFIVVYDDVDLPLGTIRIRYKGSAGTHNGMRNMVDKLGTQDFYRIRIGIGQSHEGDLYEYVLSHLTEKDKKALSNAFDKAVACIDDFTKGATIEEVMQKYN